MDPIVYGNGPYHHVFYRYHPRNAHQQLYRKYRSILYSRACRHLYDHAFLQTDQAHLRNILSRTLFGHHTRHSRPHTPLWRTIRIAIHPQRMGTLLYFVIRDPCHLYCIDPIFSKSHAASSSTKRFD